MDSTIVVSNTINNDLFVIDREKSNEAIIEFSLTDNPDILKSEKGRLFVHKTNLINALRKEGILQN